jgi:hypothetical protein
MVKSEILGLRKPEAKRKYTSLELYHVEYTGKKY